LPERLRPIAFQNKALVYSLLFRTAADTLLILGRDPKHLGADLGFFGVLHTWGQTLMHHPHIHFVVPGGGLSSDRQRWIHCRRPRFFVSVMVLSSLFRRLFLEALAAAFKQGQLQFFSELQHLRDPQAFAAYLQPLGKKKWVVYAKPPFGGPQQALAYLGRYTHRVAISNERLLSCDNATVSFGWQDYRDHSQHKTITLEADEFIRRFLLHSLPPGFQRIRHYGWLANTQRRSSVALCRQLLTADPTGLLPDLPTAEPDEVVLEALPACPVCGIGVMVRIQRLSPMPGSRVDSS
jgi:putative transposase